VAIIVTGSGPLLTGQAPAVIQRKVEGAITEAVMFLLPKIQARTPQDTGLLMRSIQADFEGKGTPLVKGIIGTSQIYGLATDQGRTPGKPLPKDLDLSGWISRRFGVDLKTAQRLNFVVKRAIMRKGTIKRFDYQGADMFGGALDAYWPQLQSIFASYGVTVAKELSNG
jgi:hypothetical protein